LLSLGLGRPGNAADLVPGGWLKPIPIPEPAPITEPPVSVAPPQIPMQSRPLVGRVVHHKPIPRRPVQPHQPAEAPLPNGQVRF
jgi:hypothetical protein